MKLWIDRIICFVLGCLCMFLFTKFNSCGKEDTPAQADSNVTKRQQVQAKKDAQVGILETPFKTELKPKAVFKQKAENQFYNETVRKDLIT